jgi:rhodanese-related sulfurtransferase
VARKLKRSGFGNVQVLEGGWHAWQAAGYPVVPK